MIKKHYIADFFRTIDSEHKAYILGFVTADGNIKKDGYYVRIILSHRDIEHLDAIRDLIAPGANVREFKRNIKGREGWFCELSIGCREMVDDLKNHGLAPAKSLTVKPWVGRADLMRHYWRGLFDGDGSLFPNKSTFGLNLVGTKDVVDGFFSFCNIPVKVRHNRKIWLGATKDLARTKSICRLLHDGSSLLLNRKKILADKIIAHEYLEKHWDDVTSSDLLALKDRLGRWSLVAKHLGLATANNVYRLCKDRGIKIKP